MGYGGIVASEHSRRKHLPGRHYENRQRASTACGHACRGLKKRYEQFCTWMGNRFARHEIESGSDQRDGFTTGRLRNNCSFPASEKLNVKVRTMRWRRVVDRMQGECTGRVITLH